MKAIRWFSKKDKVEVVQTSIPALEDPESVIVKVVYAGICGSDLHFMNGDLGPSE